MWEVALKKKNKMKKDGIQRDDDDYTERKIGRKKKKISWRKKKKIGWRKKVGSNQVQLESFLVLQINDDIFLPLSISSTGFFPDCLWLKYRSSPETVELN